MSIRACATCQASLVGRQRSARYCSDACRASARRAGASLHVVPTSTTPEDLASLVTLRVAACRSECEALGVPLSSPDVIHLLGLAALLDVEAEPRAAAALSREFRGALTDLRARSMAGSGAGTKLSAIRGALHRPIL